MILGICVSDNKGEQLFRKDQRFCQRCGKRLHVIDVTVDVEGAIKWRELLE